MLIYRTDIASTKGQDHEVDHLGLWVDCVCQGSNVNIANMHLRLSSHQVELSLLRNAWLSAGPIRIAGYAMVHP